ncbi:MAG: hypothetical protein KC910_25420 [Candidatus Eremiobacteraeota bacterium]|nr:hypothetical protein [Candidatus Eremiobacteraeota bacterium]
MSTKRSFHVLLVALAVLLCSQTVHFYLGRDIGTRPLKLSSHLRAGRYYLGMQRSSSSKDDDTVWFSGDNKCICACTTDFVDDGTLQLRTGLTTSHRLRKLLGEPSGMTHVAGSEVWVYPFALAGGPGNEAYLNVFFDRYGAWLHVYYFELTLSGGPLDRWPWADPG